uniref:Peroxin-5 n=1 Tax=Brassica oleracea var. oleracea TaxID=109376 RepID=A0A0D3ALS3_BRAOL
MKPGPASGEWATEYEQQYLGPPSWANQIANEQGTDSMLVQIDLLLCLSRIAIISQLKLLLSHGPEQWADEFASGKGQQESAEDKWVNEFSKLNVDDWVDEFAEGPVGGSSADAWGNAYDEFLTERNSEKHASGVYVFSDMNPYVGHPEPMKEGLELFRKGLLSECLIQKCQMDLVPCLMGLARGSRSTPNSEAALALEAEAIAAMMRAQEADPSNLEVLLALGVSHTSELEQATALKYLYGWLRSHPKYGTIAPPELADSLYHADALDLKPNYVRALANMGISYANQDRGMYKESIPYYVLALAMNPKADNAWQYLRLSLSCASRQNLIQACEARNLDVLQKEFPL